MGPCSLTILPGNLHALLSWKGKGVSHRRTQADQREWQLVVSTHASLPGEEIAISDMKNRNPQIHMAFPTQSKDYLPASFKAAEHALKLLVSCKKNPRQIGKE